MIYTLNPICRKHSNFKILVSLTSISPFLPLRSADLADGRAHPAHGDADVGSLESHHVIHAIAGHAHDLAALLQRLHDPGGVAQGVIICATMVGIMIYDLLMFDIAWIQKI